MALNYAVAFTAFLCIYIALQRRHDGAVEWRRLMMIAGFGLIAVLSGLVWQ